MSNTIPNVVVLPKIVTDIYKEQALIDAGVSVGDQINVAMLGQGEAQLYAGPVEPVAIDNDSGYRNLTVGKNLDNDAGDTGAFIYSLLGCTINVKVV